MGTIQSSLSTNSSELIYPEGELPPKPKVPENQISSSKSESPIIPQRNIAYVKSPPTRGVKKAVSHRKKQSSNVSSTNNTVILRANSPFVSSNNSRNSLNNLHLTENPVSRLSSTDSDRDSHSSCSNYDQEEDVMSNGNFSTFPSRFARLSIVKSYRQDDFTDPKHRKRLFKVGQRLFNDKPEEGIQFFIDNFFVK